MDHAVSTRAGQSPYERMASGQIRRRDHADFILKRYRTAAGEIVDVYARKGREPMLPQPVPTPPPQRASASASVEAASDQLRRLRLLLLAT